MSRFYASIKGNRGGATRYGTSDSGISGHVRGWNLGAEVSCYVGEDGTDRVTITLTSGSNGGKKVDMGTFKRDRNGDFLKED